jgi:hypothetical protein
MKKPAVWLGSNPPPLDDGDRWIEPPKGNNRMFEIVLYNRGREKRGTATIHRYAALLRGIKKRYPNNVLSPRGRQPIVIRKSRAGSIIVIVRPIEGPVASVATKH